MRTSRRWTGVPVLAAALLAAAAACGSGDAALAPEADTSGEDVARHAVIVTLDVRFVPEPRLTPAQVQRQRTAIRAAQRRVLASLRPYSVRVSARYVRIPQLALVVDDAGLRVLRRHPDVARVQPNALDDPGG